MKVLGTSGLMKYLNKYQIDIDEDFLEDIGSHKRKSWESFINSNNEDLVSDEALDFLDKLLVYDHAKRILPKEAMIHPYFKPVRDAVQDTNMD